MYINFSDAAKFADIARNIVNGLGYGGSFSFWPPNILNLERFGIFLSSWTPPVMPYSIAAFFKIFGVTDFAVIATSLFCFILTLIFTYLLGKKLFASKWVGALSTLAVGASYDLIHYATNGASESPFIFEIVAASYFASLKKKWANVLTVFLLVLMYFTRPQAFIYIAGIILYWLLINFKPKKAIFVFAGLIVAGLVIDRFILFPLGGKYFTYSIIGRGIYTSFDQTSMASGALRGAAANSIAATSDPVGNNNFLVTVLSPLVKNIFYNLYNFYKALPEIINPYFFALFVIGLFIRSKNNVEKYFKLSSVFIILTTFLVTAASIPFYRYLHPVIPLVYILAVGTLVELISKFEFLNSKQITISKFQIPKNTFIILSSLFLILLFGVGQTAGMFLLDSRFEAKTHNVGKPPVYAELSYILKENTNPDQVVLTNLDTWGSWYGERKTVWFPLEPKQIIDPATGSIPFDAIYLTSYKMDDANYYMGTDWRMIFENPKDETKWKCEGCLEISKEFKLKGVYKIDADEVYEKEEASSILLVKDE